jgi:hypothetical protein
VHVLQAPRGLSPDQVARLLAWRHEHHAPLGLQTMYMYLRPDDAPEYAAHAGIRQQVAAGQLQLVAWDELSSWQDWQVYHSSLQVAHGALSFWATNTLVWVADLDEWIISAVALPTLLASPGCVPRAASCFTFPRFNLAIGANGSPQAEAETQAWQQPGPLPLALPAYERPLVVRPRQVLPKSLSDPNKVWACIPACSCRALACAPGLLRGQEPTMLHAA